MNDSRMRCISCFFLLFFSDHGVDDTPVFDHQDAYDKEPSKAGLEDPASEAAKQV